MSTTLFSIQSTENRFKDYTLGKLMFGCDVILLIKHGVYWKLLRQKNQAKINKYYIRKNITRVYYDSKVIEKVMLNNKAEYKHENPYKGPFGITQCWTNGMVILKMGVTKFIYNIRHINTYKYNADVDDARPS